MLYQKQILIFSLAILGLFIFPNISKADTSYYITQNNQDNYSGSTKMIQTFTMSEDNYISGISLYANETATYNIQLCKGGPIASGTPVSAVNSECGSYEFKATTSCSVTNATYTDCDLNGSFWGTQGEYYYFVISETAGSPNLYNEIDGSYGEGDLLFYATGDTKLTGFANPAYWSYYPDLKFKIYYDNSLNIEEYPDTVVTWDYSGTIREDIPDFTTNINTICFVGSDCNIWVNYNEKMDGEEIRLIDNSNNLLDAETVSWQAPPEVSLIYPYTTESAGDIDYFSLFSPVCYDECFNDVCVEGCGISKGGFAIEWWNEEDYLPDFSFLDDDPCWDLATGTITYEIECAGRKLAKWAFEPNATTSVKLANTIDDFWENFPFATLTNVKTMINSSASSTTQLMPVLSATGSIMGYVFDADNITSDDNYSIVGEFKEWLSYAIIFFFGIYLIMRIISVINGANLPEPTAGYTEQQNAIKRGDYIKAGGTYWYRPGGKR